MNQIKAINPKYQSKVNRVVKLENAYEVLNSKRDLAYEMTEEEFIEDDKVWRKLNNMCETAWGKYWDAKYDLPKREQENIEKNLYRMRGY
jgi:hypothetical protein